MVPRVPDTFSCPSKSSRIFIKSFLFLFISSYYGRSSVKVWYVGSGTYFYTIKALCTKTQNVRDFINFAFWSRKESEEEEDDDDDEEEEENPIALPFFSPKNDHRSF